MMGERPVAAAVPLAFHSAGAGSARAASVGADIRLPHQRPCSANWPSRKPANSSGVFGRTSPPSATSCSATEGSAAVAFSAALSPRRISSGVPAGRKTPFHS